MYYDSIYTGIYALVGMEITIRFYLWNFHIIGGWVQFISTNIVMSPFGSNTMYVAATDGFAIVDVSDPASPTEFRVWQNPKTASFWAARAARLGEFFIASSASNPGKGEDERLYTFPEPPLRETTNG
jgi:hypothetical protein